MNLKLQNILYKLSNRNNGDVDTNFTRFCQFVSPSCCFIELQSFLESKTNRQFWGKNLSNFLGEQICVVSNGFIKIMKSEPFFTYFSIPNRRVGQNKRAGGKILRKH